MSALDMAFTDCASVHGFHIGDQGALSRELWASARTFVEVQGVEEMCGDASGNAAILSRDSTDAAQAAKVFMSEKSVEGSTGYREMECI